MSPNDICGNYLVINIGSNSVKELRIQDGKAIKRAYVTRLAEGIESGSLSDDSIERTLSVISDITDRLPPEPCRIFVFATEAVRCSKNGRQFADRVSALTGATTDILSGEQEALAGYVGACGGRRCLLMDIGGASTELCGGTGSGTDADCLQ